MVEMAFLATPEPLLLKPYLDLGFVDVLERDVLSFSVLTEDNPRTSRDIDWSLLDLTLRTKTRTVYLNQENTF
jgi:hypothetical protein